MRISDVVASAKRGRCDIVFDRLRADYGPMSESEKEYRRQHNVPAPFIWLTCTRIGFFKDGPALRERVKEGVIASFTRHCVARLIQRHELSSARELMQFIREIWPTIVFADLCLAEFKKARDGSEWLVPVHLKGDRVAVLGIATSNPDDEFDRLMIRTALRLDQLGANQFEPVEALANYMFATCNHPVAPTDEALKLFDACRNINHTWAGDSDIEPQIALTENINL